MTGTCGGRVISWEMHSIAMDSRAAAAGGRIARSVAAGNKRARPLVHQQGVTSSVRR